MNHAANILAVICNNEIRNAEVMLHSMSRVEDVLLEGNGLRTVTYRARWVDKWIAPKYLHDPQAAATLARVVGWETGAFDSDDLVRAVMKEFSEKSRYWMIHHLFNRVLAQAIIVRMLNSLLGDENK